ncbi:hypothetical protein [Chryseobacterium chendengshani]|uniref:hypothetical protein n=1 Tax=unclassified Chryseobacterium TaxID=2593645 RepID=UPI001C63C7F7|nr:MULTISPECIES: hypothetical protein [unclassified Chryseobacterium]MBW7674922.1 hypothetical protein [Chryseobacterium sp. LJ756]MBW8523465.1 hypothetical protein [Chryseobacterium sp. LJ668]QYK15751.1 hypothetical protein K0U91_11850 [Chryseobacterium sp. LJ668]
MKKFLISAIVLIGFSVSLNAQKRPPAPPHPSKTELSNSKLRELNKRYNSEKKMILNHPVATKKMKNDQLKALNIRYQNEKKLLRATR